MEISLQFCRYIHHKLQLPHVETLRFIFYFIHMGFGWMQALTLHLEDDATPKTYRYPPQKLSREVSQQEGWTLMHTALVASAVTVLSISVVLYLRRSNS
jgi:hypothetical protein